jgi:hypothetical protein
MEHMGLQSNHIAFGVFASHCTDVGWQSSFNAQPSASAVCAPNHQALQGPNTRTTSQTDHHPSIPRLQQGKWRSLERPPLCSGFCNSARSQHQNRETSLLHVVKLAIAQDLEGRSKESSK